MLTLRSFGRLFVEIELLTRYYKNISSSTKGQVMKIVALLGFSLLAVMPGGLLVVTLYGVYRRAQKSKKMRHSRNFEIRPLTKRANPERDTVEVVYIPSADLVRLDPEGVYCARI